MSICSARALAASVVLAVAAAAPSAQVASNSEREEFTAFAINMSNVGGTGAGVVDFTVERWTTPAERDRFMALFKEKGAQGLLDAFQEAKRVGTIRTPTSLAYDLRYAVQVPAEEGGRRIILATDRPIGFYEATARPRSYEYPFTLIELQLDRNGEGSGKLSIATKLTLVANVLIIEEFANQPIMLNDVKKRK
jgi:hypothetical protein